MFRLQNNTPSVYTNQSRDFQLFCRLYDCINNGVKFDIDTMINILDPMKINDRMLNLLCTKVGFFPKVEYDSNILRHIIASFPYALKHKGTKLGIEIAVGTILKAEKDWSATSELTFKDIETIVQIDNLNHNINIYTTFEILNIQPLEDFLSYVLPVGYTYNIGLTDPRTVDHTITSDNTYISMVNPSISNSQVIGVDRVYNPNGDEYQFKTNIEANTVGTYNATEVIGANNYMTQTPFGTNNQTIEINGEETTLNTQRDSIDKSKNTVINPQESN